MLRNYFKTALRNLWRNRTYGLLNIMGLAVGIACATLILLWVQDEVTYDRHNVKYDRLYFVKNNQTYGAVTYTFSATPGPLGPAMQTEIPGIVNTARSSWTAASLFAKGEKAIYEEGSFVDASFLRMFTVDFLRGSAEKPFPQLHSIVISEKMARKFFGDEDAFGKSLKMNNAQEYTVTGVFREQPRNSSLTDQWFAPFEIHEKANSWLSSWSSNGILTFVELAPNADVAKVGQQLHGFIHAKSADAVSTSILFPMSQWRLYDSFTNGKQDGGRIEYVHMFTLVACFILIIACINFMNLATARSEKRAREVGMRKVLGGTKAMLVTQFIGESLVLAYLSVVVAIALTYLALPAFNTLVEKELTLNLLDTWHLGGLLTIGLLTGLLAGSYPSFYLSSFAPVAVLKGLRVKTDSGAGFIRKGLVVFQFSVSIVLIIGTVIVYQQIQYAKARQLGYDKAHLVYLTLNDNSRSHFTAVRNELLATGGVEEVALSSSPVLSMYSNAGGFQWEGKDPDKDILITRERVSPEYIKTLGLQLLAGRNFRSDINADTANIIINETLAKLIGKKDIIGTRLTTVGGQRLEVIGLVKDFLFNDFYKAPEPLMLYVDATAPSFLTIRFKAGQDLSSALERAGAVMKTANPGYPFEYKFVDEEFGRRFSSEALIGKLAGVFATLAILISCLGLFGLAAYTTERRTREIGIRKVLGASTKSLVQLLSRDFLVLVGISCLIALPVAWWASHSWLQNYAYHTPIHWWVFGLAAVVSLLITLLTVSFQAVKAALANPVKSLRTE